MRDLFVTFGRVGVMSFGGPAGQIALMHRVLVDEKKWLDEPRFLHALNFCMLLPGPEAMQLATYAGWLLRGTAGGVLAGVLFVLPGFAVITALSALYVFHGDVPAVDGFLFGLSAAVLAIVVEALLKVARRALLTPRHAAVAVAAFVAIAFFKLPFPLIVALAALAGLLLLPAGATEPRESAPARGTGRGWIANAALWAALWLMPLAALWLTSGPGNVFADMAAFFSRAAIVTFGGAYAVLAYVAQQAVGHYGWLDADAMIAGLGLAETTPGPLILVLVFVGFSGGAALSALPPLAGGLAGALTALWFTFVPCFLWILAGAPHVERLRNVAWIARALGAITAAVVGVIANLALWFALHVLFGTFGETVIGPLHLPAPDLATLNVPAALIAGASALLLLRWKLNLFAVLGLAAAAGVAVRLLTA